jgi:hypothetical protein
MLKTFALLLAFVSVNACGSDDVSRSSSERGQGVPQYFSEKDLPFNLLKQKSVHNAYQRKESIEDMYNVYGLRSIELDIHSNKLFRPLRAKDWYVYHEWFDLKSNVDTLSEGLRRVADVMREDHDAMTLFVDLKSVFDAEHTAEDLDQLLSVSLGDKIMRPRDLIERCSGSDRLEEAVRLCGWPTRSEMRGHVLIILTGASADPYAPNSLIAADRLAFVAPTITKESETIFHSHAVFFNLSKSTVFGSELSERLVQEGKIIRTWDLNSNADWQKALNKPVTHLATNKVNTETDPWAIIQNAFTLDR